MNGTLLATKSAPHSLIFMNKSNGHMTNVLVTNKFNRSFLIIPIINSSMIYLFKILFILINKSDGHVTNALVQIFCVFYAQKSCITYVLLTVKIISIIINIVQIITDL